MTKKIVHIDLNAFFAQCEVNENHNLIGKPIAIGSNGKRGVVSTCSYEARKYKVHSGMPMSQAKELCKDLIVIPGDYHLYARESSKFFGFLRKKYKEIEQASIDECYIDMTEYIEDDKEHDYLLDLQLMLYKATSLKCSIGLGDNKFLAKMGSDYKKPLGITIIHQDNLKEILWPLPISNMFGIGKKTAPKLIALGIETIGDLANTNDSNVKSLLGNTFEYHKSHANGFGNDIVDSSPFDPKSVGASRTFLDDTTDYDEIKNMIIYLAKQVSEEMIKYHKKSQTVTVTLRDENFVTHSRQLALVKMTNSQSEIAQAALYIFERFWNEQPIRLVGVSMQNVKDENEEFEQLELFTKDNVNVSKNKKEDETIAKLMDKGLLKKASDIKPKKKKEIKEAEYHPFRGLD